MQSDYFIFYSVFTWYGFGQQKKNQKLGELQLLPGKNVEKKIKNITLW
jgi:hypothetical protein